jgi:hypothetical protein
LRHGSRMGKRSGASEETNAHRRSARGKHGGWLFGDAREADDGG